MVVFGEVRQLAVLDARDGDVALRVIGDCDLLAVFRHFLQSTFTILGVACRLGGASRRFPPVPAL